MTDRARGRRLKLQRMYFLLIWLKVVFSLNRSDLRHGTWIIFHSSRCLCDLLDLSFFHSFVLFIKFIVMKNSKIILEWKILNLKLIIHFRVSVICVYSYLLNFDNLVTCMEDSIIGVYSYLFLILSIFDNLTILVC